MSSRLFGKKKQKETSEERFFLKNGAAVLEQLISSLNGDCNPIRNYSAQQLKTATNSFHLDLKLYGNDWYELYKGNHEDREIAVKIFIYKPRLENIANEAAIASRMSSHNNVLKLLGCCLETEWPILVYEYPKMGNLLDCLKRTDLDVPLTLELRLRIAMKVANAVAYLHHGLSKKFIHGDIKSSNIFLDQNFEPKLFEFQFALSIPEDKNHVEVDGVFGTVGFLAPETYLNLRYSEKSDVYAFGCLFSEILTKKSFNNFVLFEFDNIVLFEGESAKSFKSAKSFEGESAKSFESESAKSFKSAKSFEGESAKSFEGESAKSFEGESAKSFESESAISFERKSTAGVLASAVRFCVEASTFFQEENRAQVMEATKLIEACLKNDPDDRPDMIEVAKALRLIISS